MNDLESSQTPLTAKNQQLVTSAWKQCLPDVDRGEFPELRLLTASSPFPNIS